MANPESPPNTLRFCGSNRTPGSSATQPEAKYLVYFLPGNPGLIEYYKAFLRILHKQLSNQMDVFDQHTRVEVLGISLAGFECGPAEEKDVRRKAQKLPLDIDGQLNFVESFLGEHTERDTRVILMGHSLGAYLVMEMLQRRRIHLKQEDVSIIGAIGLFPAVVHLAQSEGGRRIQRLLAIPGLAFVFILLVRFLGLLPTRILRDVIQIFLGYPEDAAAATVHWMQSRWGFQESIHLLREELTRITADTWDDETWGSRVHLLFGEQDNWVSNIERDALILLAEILYKRVPLSSSIRPASN